MVKEGYGYGLPLIAMGGALLAIGVTRRIISFDVAGALFLALALFVLNFFRNPSRAVPSARGVFVSPADGRVVQVTGCDYSGESFQLVSIFMSPLNVHINRAPISGTIAGMSYKKGSFRAAWDRRASVENEQNVVVIEGEQGKVIVKQIAGVLARRIVAWKRPGDWVEKGERIGMIKFGSRVDVYIHPSVRLEVKLGDKVFAGSSVLGTTDRNEA